MATLGIDDDATMASFSSLGVGDHHRPSHDAVLASDAQAGLVEQQHTPALSVCLELVLLGPLWKQNQLSVIFSAR